MGVATPLGHFSHAHRAKWEELVLQGYRLQFRCRPPPFRGVWSTTTADPLNREALQLEIAFSTQRGNQTTQTIRRAQWVLLSIFPSTQEGISVPHPTGYQPRPLVHDCRPKRCLLPCTDPPSSQEVPVLCIQRHSIRVQSVTFWPLPGTNNIHKMYG
jgi:hypothetical protein